MTTTELLVRHRHILLQLAEKVKNISRACRTLGFSRESYYKYKRLFDRYGIDGLKDKQRRPPNMPNKASPQRERAVLDYCLEYPTHGPLRIAHELKKKNIDISSGGVYNILKRHNLNRRHQRLLRLEQESARNGFILTEEQFELLMRESEKFQESHVEARYTGALISQDTFYVGTLKGVGRIYAQNVVDCYSSFGFSELYTDKSAESATDILRSRVKPFYAGFGYALHRVLSDNGTEYTHYNSTEEHPYEIFLREHHIRHTYTKVRNPKTNGFVERFHQTLLNEFFRVAFRKKFYKSLDELQRDLDEHLIEYNFQRAHQGYRLKGKTPIQKFLDGSRAPALPPPI